MTLLRPPNSNSTSHDLQKHVFRRQLALGVSLGLPLVLHVRDAEQDALDIAMEVSGRRRRVGDVLCRLFVFSRGGGASLVAWW